MERRSYRKDIIRSFNVDEDVSSLSTGLSLQETEESSVTSLDDNVINSEFLHKRSSLSPSSGLLFSSEKDGQLGEPFILPSNDLKKICSISKSNRKDENVNNRLLAWTGDTSSSRDKNSRKSDVDYNLDEIACIVEVQLQSGNMKMLSVFLSSYSSRSEIISTDMYKRAMACLQYSREPFFSFLSPW
jgi:hypothetical protein